jgi:hypothetical protein
VSTQRQTAIKLLPPSDYKLPLGEQAVRTEPARMGGDKIKAKKKITPHLLNLPFGFQSVINVAIVNGWLKNKLKKKRPLKGLVCNRLPYQPIHQVPYHLIS